MLAFAAHTLSIARVLLVIVATLTIVREQFELSFVLLVLAVITDWIDGPLARRAGGTKSGKILDPLGDSFLAFLPQIALVKIGTEPLWMFVTYVILAAGLALLRLFFLKRKQDARARVVRFFQVVGILEAAQIAILLCVGFRAGIFAPLAVIALYLGVILIKHRRIRYFLSFLKE